MLKLENSIRGLSFSRVAFDLTIHDNVKRWRNKMAKCIFRHLFCYICGFSTGVEVTFTIL